LVDVVHWISVLLEKDACADMLMYGAWKPPLARTARCVIVPSELTVQFVSNRRVFTWLLTRLGAVYGTAMVVELWVAYVASPFWLHDPLPTS
jgi:hypothetical protein